MRAPLALWLRDSVRVQLLNRSRTEPCRTGRCTLTLIALVSVLPVMLRGQAVTDFVLATAANCALREPPQSAGIAATPGGFVMVHPRNDAIDGQYTGCRILWVVDVDRMRRLATLYFERGVLVRALAHDVRDPGARIDAACDLAAGRSLLPAGGRRIDDAGCRATPRDALYALRVPTWPRQCLTDTEAAVCKADPQPAQHP